MKKIRMTLLSFDASFFFAREALVGSRVSGSMETLPSSMVQQRCGG
jgi:hypothetical protein